MVLAVLAAGEVGARIVGPEIPRTAGTEERAFVKADQMYERGSADVAVLGSLETAGGLVPSIIEERAPEIGSVYNAALAGTFLPTYQEWAERVVIPALDPDVVVIGMLPMTVADIEAVDSASYTEPRDAYSDAMDQITGGSFGDLGWALRQRSALIRYRPELRQPDQLARGVRAVLRGGDDTAAPGPGTGMDWTTETDPATVLANTGPDGEVFDYHASSLPIDADPLGSAIYRTFEEGSLDLQGIEELTAALRGDGVEPVIVVLPVDRGPLEAGGADLSVLDAWTASLQDWAADHDVALLDEFTAPWPSDLFHDRNHLDVDGAAELSRVVGDWLAELCGEDRLPGACDGTS